jgi:hypothetical protein
MSSIDRRRWKGLSAETKRLLAASPDEHVGLEFKEDEHPITAESLAIFANTAALQNLPNMSVLVGVREHRDAKGVVTAEVIGLGGDLHKIAESIHQRASNTGPLPVSVEIYEENTADKPILRLVVSPVLAPHYDSKGRRAVRHGATTRAMRDEELLRLLQARESSGADIVKEAMGDFRVVLEEQAEELRDHSDATRFDVADALNEFASRFDDLEIAIYGLPSQQDLAMLDDELAVDRVWRAVRIARRNVGRLVPLRLHDLPAELIDELQNLLDTTPRLEDYDRNFLERAAWDKVFTELPGQDPTKFVEAVRTLVDTRRVSADAVTGIDLRAMRQEYEKQAQVDQSAKDSTSGRPSRKRTRSGWRADVVPGDARSDRSTGPR